MGDLNHWAVGWVDWNMVLNERGGPNHVGNYCDAPILAYTKTDKLLYESTYYYMGHFAKYIRPVRRADRLHVEESRVGGHGISQFRRQTCRGGNEPQQQRHRLCLEEG